MAKIVHDEGTESARRRQRSRFHSGLLLLAMAALLAYCGWIVADWQGILWSLLASTAMLVMLRRMPPDVFLQALNAHALGRWEAPALYQILEDLCRIAGVEASPLLCRVFGPAPVAFTIGGGNAATIVLSQSLLQTMNTREMRGILAHEIIHLRNGDLALMQLAVVVGRLTRVLSQIALLLVLLGLMLRAVSARAFPLLPLVVLAAAPLGVNLLQLALSREREAEADLEAAELTGDPYGLASALIKMRNQEQALLRNWYPGMIPLRVPALLRDHPPTQERIRRLLAMISPPDRSLAEEPSDEIWRHRRADPRD
jgi:heat shock protein HtpX